MAVAVAAVTMFIINPLKNDNNPPKNPLKNDKIIAENPLKNDKNVV
ncbi:MAG: hypothetical protein IKP67_09430 [Spirochaetales bacterium]|nr:hypothetical protein [Spirochaetales bacterium]